VSEPAVTLTDWLLAVECAVFAGMLRGGFARLFAALALASLLGGTVHGFFPEEFWLDRALWRAALLALGASALFAAEIAGDLLGWARTRIVTRLVFLGYAGLILTGRDRFGIAVTVYLPAVLLLLFALARESRIRGERRIALGVWGLVGTLVAALGQQLRLGAHPVYFDHNALYHVVQAAALVLVFVGGRALASGPTAPREGPC
jgi:hypothetical protein